MPAERRARLLLPGAAAAGALNFTYLYSPGMRATCSRLTVVLHANRHAVTDWKGMRMTVLQTQDNQLPTRGAGIAIALGAETVVVGILLVQAIWNLTAAAYLLLCVKVQGDPVGVRGFEAPASASRT
jgi:hypothetical protein